AQERSLYAAADHTRGSGGRMEMRVALVGCGLIGNKRARCLGAHRLVAAVDPHQARAQQLASQHAGCTAGADWRTVVERGDVDALIVSTTNEALAPVTAAALARGKHVLVE